jgi:pimeloyl-ACP methyl ester carboxylesterase
MNFGQRERVERGLAVILTAASAIARWTQRSLIGLLLALGVTQALAQSAAVPQPYTEVFYPSGPLRIQAYLYRPPGDGPFPLVIYNHGSRANSEREPRPFSYVGRILLRSGYAVLVPERRGYGRSDGPTFSEETLQDTGPLPSGARRGALDAADSPHFVGRLQAESDDVPSGVGLPHDIAVRGPEPPRHHGLVVWRNRYDVRREPQRRLPCGSESGRRRPRMGPKRGAA